MEISATQQVVAEEKERKALREQNFQSCFETAILSLFYLKDLGHRNVPLELKLEQGLS